MSVPQAWPDISGRIEDGIHLLPIRIYYEDTDFSGIVYHANYLRFAERSRSDFLRLAGVHHHELFEGDNPLAFAIHRMEMDFVRPARIDDVLEVRTRYITARGARLEVLQSIWRGDEELWRAKVMAAVIDQHGKPRRLPKSVVEKLTPLVRPLVEGA